MSTLESRCRPSRGFNARRLARVKDRSRRIWRHAERARRPSAVRAEWRGEGTPPPPPAPPPKTAGAGGETAATRGGRGHCYRERGGGHREPRVAGRERTPPT